MSDQVKFNTLEDIVEWTVNEEGRSESVSVTEEPADLTKSEEAWLNTLTDSLHLEERASSDEMTFNEEDPLRMLRDAVARCYEQKFDLPPSACLPYKVEEAASESKHMGVGSMTEVCKGLAEIFSTLKKLEETRAQLAVEVMKRRVSRAKLFLNLLVTARYIISGLWPLQVDEKLSFR